MQSIPSFLRRCCSWSALAATAFLVGCASGPVTYTTSVQSYSSMAGITLPNTYRLELLPSQIQNQQNFAVVEIQAQKALSNVGLQPAADPAQAPLVVQIDAISAASPSGPAYAPYYGPASVYGWGFGRPWTPGPWGPGPWGHGPWGGPAVGWAFDAPPTIYHRSVNLVIRDAKNQRIVYETSAQYNDLRANDSMIWGLLFNAALNDFPNPPQGVRQVQTTVTPIPATPASHPAPATPKPKPDQ